jgi:hypothetical protein
MKMCRIDMDFKKTRNNNAENAKDSRSACSDDYEHLVFDIEEVECKMTDIEERDRSDESRSLSSRDPNNGGHGSGADNKSVRGSILHSPKNYQFNRGNRFSEMSVMSSVANQHHMQLNT